jgi:hypothetical protein
MLHVEQWTLRSRMDITDAGAPPDGRWVIAEVTGESRAGADFAGDVMPLLEEVVIGSGSMKRGHRV